LEKDIVIGIDSSTSATKATAWTREGILVGEGRQSIPMTNPLPNRFEQDPSDWWGSTCDALQSLFHNVDPTRVAAVSISNQRETFGVFDADGNSVRPAMVWLDERAIAEVEAIDAALGADRVREISGKPLDVLLPYNRMAWLRKNEPDHFDAIHRYADVHCFLCFQLTGNWTTSQASADPSGMLDIQQRVWSEEVLIAAGVPEDYMPDLAAPGALVGHITPIAATKTGLPADTPLFAGGGDGQCAACGAGVTSAGVAYMNLGTAIVSGVYSEKYAHDQAFRTEIAVADKGYIFETVLKSGTFLVDWFARELGGADTGAMGEVLSALGDEASKSAIGAGGLVLLPFWQGSMTPHWDAKARGIIAGLSGSTRRGDIFRAVLEGLALDQAFALEQATHAISGDISRIIAIGGGTASDLWLQIVADALNVPVSRAKVAEASALGAANCAAKGAGWYKTIADASHAMSQPTERNFDPVPQNVARYKEFRAIYDDLWPMMQQWNARLWDFANKACVHPAK
jgi:xylulokinase